MPNSIGNLAAIPAPQPTSAATTAFNRLEEAVRVAEDLAAQLEQAFGPALFDLSPDNKAPQVPPPSTASPLLGRLGESITRIESVGVRLNSLIGRCVF